MLDRLCRMAQPTRRSVLFACEETGKATHSVLNAASKLLNLTTVPAYEHLLKINAAKPELHITIPSDWSDFFPIYDEAVATAPRGSILIEVRVPSGARAPFTSPKPRSLPTKTCASTVSTSGPRALKTTLACSTRSTARKAISNP